MRMSKDKIMESIKQVYRPIDDNEPVDADKVFEDLYNCFNSNELDKFLEHLREEYETNIDEDSELEDLLDDEE